MTNKALTLDERLAQLVVIGEQQQQNIAAVVEGINGISQGMFDLKEITRQQAQTAASQQKTIKQFANVFAQQARTISELSRSVQASVESSRQAAQAARAASVVAQDNQNAIRDLIEELRRDR